MEINNLKKIFAPQDKVLANADKIIEFLKTGNTIPVLVEIDPSNSCNHACPFCISSYLHLDESKNLETFDRTIMSREMLFSVCKDLIDMKVSAISWTGGGEPWVNQHLRDVIQYVGENSSIRMGMFTNGTMIDKQNAFEVLSKYMTWVRFSIDCGTKETYNTIRRPRNGNHDWNKMISNLSILLDTKEKMNSKLDVGVGFVITPDNYHEIVDFALYFQNFNLKYCQYKPEIVNQEREDGVQRKLEFWKEKVEPMLDEAKNILGDKFQINGYKLSDLKNDPTLLGRRYKKCLGSQIQPCVGADGEVYICVNQRGYKEYSYGSLHEKSFKDIWNDIEKRNEIRWKIDERDKFKNCTQLCKPHSSNQKMYDIYEKYNSMSYDDKLHYEQELLQIEMPNARSTTEHWEFI